MMSERRERGRLQGVLEWLGVFLIAFAVFALIRTFVMTPYAVPTGSMEPTIQIGDSIFAQKVTLLLGDEPDVGDIVVFDNPVSGTDHDILIKRIVARAGQTVDLVDGSVVVDGVPLEEPYARGGSYPLPTQAPGVELSYPYTVPEGHVWVMGDNRENSADSRYFGAVPEGNIEGVAFFRYWPFLRIGGL